MRRFALSRAHVFDEHTLHDPVIEKIATLTEDELRILLETHPCVEEADADAGIPTENTALILKSLTGCVCKLFIKEVVDDE